MPDAKRTSVLFRPYDIEQLETVQRLLHDVDATAAMRAALQVTAEMLEAVEDGWTVQLVKGRAKQHLRFV